MIRGFASASIMSGLFRRLGIFILGAAFPYRGIASETTTIIDIGPSDFRESAILAEPGVFHVSEDTNSVDTRCIQSNGVWLKVERQTVPCGPYSKSMPPPHDLVQDLPALPTGEPLFVIGNLGVNTEQWKTAVQLAHDPSVPKTNLLKSIGQAAQLGVVDGAIRWQFDSSLLPAEFSDDIPGSGIWFHIKEIFSNAMAPAVFDGQTKALFVQAKVGIPDIAVRGAASATVTIGVDMQALDSTGRRTALQLLICLYNSAREGREYVGSDGRNIAAVTELSGHSTFVTPVKGKETTGIWSGSEEFSFLITPATLNNLIGSVNRFRGLHGQPLLQNSPSSVYLKGIDIRNEYRHLGAGDVRMSLDLEELCISRVAD